MAATNNDAVTESAPVPEQQEQPEQNGAGDVFKVTVKLPHEPFGTEIHVRLLICIIVAARFSTHAFPALHTGAGPGPPPVHRRDAADIPVLVLPPRT